MRPPSKQTLGYLAVLAASLALAIVSGMTAVANQFDDAAYDWMFRLQPPATGTPKSVVLGIDDATLGAMGGPPALRSMLAAALERLAAANPKAVAIDVVLADVEDAAVDQRLERAMRNTPNLVLVSHLAEGRWQKPLPGFARYAAGLGHDTADENSRDGVTRQIPLEERTERERYWALALETFRLVRGQRVIVESPRDLQVASEMIPAARAVLRRSHSAGFAERTGGSAGRRVPVVRQSGLRGRDFHHRRAGSRPNSER